MRPHCRQLPGKRRGWKDPEKFESVETLPAARMRAVFYGGSMITVERQSPPASISSPVKLSQTKLVTGPCTASARRSWVYACSCPFCGPVYWHFPFLRHCRGCHATRMRAGNIKASLKAVCVAGMGSQATQAQGALLVSRPP